MNEETSSRDELAREVQELRARAEEQQGQLLRALADLDNHRKRAAREREEARKYALQGFVVSLLPVKDGLERALGVEPADRGGEAEALREGIRLTLRLWNDVFARAGVEEVDPLGQPFAPDFHEALSVRAVPGATPNTVLEVVHKGYLLNGRLIRPAQVIVARAGGTGEPGRENDDNVDADDTDR
jgi:molecular chaperone GrpE